MMLGICLSLNVVVLEKKGRCVAKHGMRMILLSKSLLYSFIYSDELEAAFVRVQNAKHH